MARNEPLNRKAPKLEKQTKGKVVKILAIALVALVVLGFFLNRYFPPDLPDAAELRLRHGESVMLSQAEARRIFRDMRTLPTEKNQSTFPMEGSYWITFLKGEKIVAELAIGPGDVVMMVDLAGYTHMKQPSAGKGLDYAGLAALFEQHLGE